jgi:hypothetical protein
MRVEEIALNLGRWLGSGGSQFSEMKRSPESRLAEDILPLSLLDAQTPAVDTAHMAENVLGSGAYVFEPLGEAVLVLGIQGEKAAALRHMVMESDPDAGGALPKSVRIDVDSAQIGPGRWRLFWSGDMGRDGVLDTGRLGGTLARRIRITILSAWSPGPVRIDKIEAR